jgi:preprotein translocase subunit SecF
MYRGKTHFDFVGASKTSLKVSLALVILSILIIVVRPFNLSIDFTGASSLQFRTIRTPRSRSTGPTSELSDSATHVSKCQAKAS